MPTSHQRGSRVAAFVDSSGERFFLYKSNKTKIMLFIRYLFSIQKRGADHAMVSILPSIDETLEALTSDSSSSPQQRSATLTNADMMDVHNRCKICFTNDLNVLFLPCRHFVSCLSCSKRISTCIICRQDISFLIRAYMS